MATINLMANDCMKSLMVTSGFFYCPLFVCFCGLEAMSERWKNFRVKWMSFGWSSIMELLIYKIFIYINQLFDSYLIIFCLL